MEFVVSSKSQSKIGRIIVVWSLWTEVYVVSRKQWVEPVSTRVGIGILGIRLEVSWSIKQLGLERVDALRSVVAPIRSTQPWSSARVRGLLPNFWLHGNRVVVYSCTYRCSTSFCGGRLRTISGNMTRFTAEEAWVIVHATLPLFLGEPAIFPELC